MFKLIALIGAVAGGATYGIYESGYLDRDCDGGGCSISKPLPCCAEKPNPEGSAESCEGETSSCCSAKAKPFAAKTSCCSEEGADPTSLVSAKGVEKAATKAAAFCCPNPCLACVLIACDGCAECATCCGGDNAKGAVAGMAVVAAKVK